MRRLELLTYFAVLGGVWVGCSPAPGGKTNDIGNGGGGNVGGTAGANGGSGAIIGTGGANGGSGAIIGTGGGNSGGTGAICDQLTVTPTPVTPTVMILVDNSSSMYEPRDQLWDALYSALMNPTMGAVKSLESKIRFGFASFRGTDNISVPETDPSCAEIESVGTVTQATVAPALDNYAAIDAVYQALGAQGRDPNNAQWETPTGHAISRVAATLKDFNADPPGPKFILLVTDGNPNTCKVGDPQCGQDVSVKAVQDAFANGIGTIPLGIGDIVATNSGCTPTSMRCGTLHLQDILNAGMGLPVEPEPMGFWYEQCAAQASGTNPGTPLATYAAVGGGSTANPPLTAANPTEIQTKLAELLNNVVSCTVDMDAIVTGNPALGTVTVTTTAGASRQVANNDPNDGWSLETNKFQVTLTGQACTDYKVGGVVNIVFPCDVAEPR